MKYSLTHLFRAVPIALFGIVTCVATTTAAFAAGYGELGLQLSTERTEDASSAATTVGSAVSERHFRFDIATGLRTRASEADDVTYGLVYKTDRGLQNSADLSGYALGAFVGWLHGPISIRLDYLFLAELKSNSGVVETQYREGSGISFEARWLQWFGEFAVGPSLTFTQMNFTKARVGSLPEIAASRKTESLTPGLRGIFSF